MKLNYLTAAGLISAFLLALTCANADEEDGITVEKISDKVIIVSLGGFSTQTAIASEKGIVVIDNVWSGKSAKLYRKAIEKEFGRSDFIYAIDIIDDLMNVGGNCAYPEATIIAHEELFDSLKKINENLADNVERRAMVFDTKVKRSEERLKELDPESDEAKGWAGWRDICRRLADELRDNYVLELPSMTFNDSMSIDLGDITLNMTYFGASDYRGSTIIHVPEEGVVMVGATFHSAHLSPTLRDNPAGFDVPRWLRVLGDILDGENAVKHVITSYSDVWPREKLEARRDYIKMVWESVNDAISKGIDFETAKDLFSLDKKFSYVKEWDIYKRDADWALEEHERTLNYFWREAQKRH